MQLGFMTHVAGQAGAATVYRDSVELAVGVDEPTDDVVARLAGDPALPWATQLVVQASPARAPFASQLGVLRRWAREIGPQLTSRRGTRGAVPAIV